MEKLIMMLYGFLRHDTVEREIKFNSITAIMTETYFLRSMNLIKNTKRKTGVNKND